jgi:hypothetical protein
MFYSFTRIAAPACWASSLATRLNFARIACSTNSFHRDPAVETPPSRKFHQVKWKAHVQLPGIPRFRAFAMGFADEM